MSRTWIAWLIATIHSGKIRITAKQLCKGNMIGICGKIRNPLIYRVELRPDIPWSIIMVYPPESLRVFYGWVPRDSNLWKNNNFEYAQQILNGNIIEPPISENHNRIQIITSFAYCMHIINSLVCNIMYLVNIWQEVWIRLEILGKNDMIFLMFWPLLFKLWVLEY